MRHALPVLPFLLCLHAPAQEPKVEASPVQALKLGEEIGWMSDGAEFFERTKTPLPVVDRSQLIDDACARAKAEHKLVLWYVHRIDEKNLGGRQMYRSPVLDVYMRQVLFTDPDVVPIVKTCFVPLRAMCDEKLSARFDLRPLQFVEPAVVFLDGDGKVVHYVERIRTFNANWFTDLLARVLDHAKVQRGPAGTVAELRAQGRFAEAMARLAAQPEHDTAGWIELASLQRLLRLPEQAHDSLKKAEGATSPAAAVGEGRSGRRASGNGDLLCERGLLLTLQGQLQAALPVLEQAWRSGSARAPEAGYLHALNLLRLGDEAGAMRRFQLVASKYPGHWAGRKAAANTLLAPDDRPFGAAFTGFESMTWLPDAAYRGLPRDTQWAGDKLAPAQLAEQAVRFLLAQQRDDGGFSDARYAYWPDSKITPNVWIAITALCCTALLEHRAVAPERVDAALQKAEAFLFDSKRLNRGFNEDVYSDTYRLLYLARKTMLSDPKARAELVARMNALVAEAATRQKVSGFWAHEYENAFCTGAMMWGLLVARSSGATVPNEVTDKGAGALLRARGPEGGFVYGGAMGDRPPNAKDSSGRGPVCEATLLAFGRSDLDKVRASLDTMWKYMDRLEQVRRNDFHSDGELGGFFFFHSVFHASEVLQLLPAEERAAHRQKFLTLLQRIPEMDGSFLDSHEFGRSYGTAAALLTLKNATARD